MVHSHITNDFAAAAGTRSRSHSLACGSAAVSGSPLASRSESSGRCSLWRGAVSTGIAPGSC